MPAARGLIGRGEAKLNAGRSTKNDGDATPLFSAGVPRPFEGQCHNFRRPVRAFSLGIATKFRSVAGRPQVDDLAAGHTCPETIGLIDVRDGAEGGKELL